MTEASEGLRKGLSKRGFLKAAGAAAVGTGVLALGLERMRTSERIRDFSTDEVDYRLLCGPHGSDSLPLDIGTVLKKDDVPDDTTVFVLETGTLPYLDPDYYPKLDRVYKRAGEAEPFLKDVWSVLLDKKSPLVLTDIPSVSPDPEMVTLVGGSLIPGITMFLLGRKESNVSRRNLLFGGALTVLGLGTVKSLSGDLLSYLNQIASEPWAQKAAKINHYVELSQPDSLAVTFRNSINAAKALGLEDQFPQNPQTHRPKALLLYGGGHWGLPEYFKSGKQAILDYLSLYPKVFIDKTFGLDNPHLYTSAILTPNENDEIVTKTIEDKDLKNIFTK